MNSSLPFTSVVSYHTQPHGCGVANFSKQLADRLGVPFVGLGGDWGNHALLSLKWSEITYPDVLLTALPVYSQYSVFWHDRGNDIVSGNAQCVFHADPSLGPNGLWCPSLLKPSKPRVVRLFSFGMANRLQTAHYAKVRNLLEAAGLDYRLRVSVGLHEGTSLSDATRHFDALREIMGPEKVTILGCLSDDAVAEELQNSDCVLAFFDKGLRANNTTVHAALDYGKRVITNRDADTPRDFIQATFDALSMTSWPGTHYHYTWDNLIDAMEAIYATTTNRQRAHI